MTPKEKAEDLFVTYYELIDDCFSNEAAKKIAKTYALILVDEILNNNCGSTTDFGVDAQDEELYMDEYYWMEVKEKINKL